MFTVRLRLQRTLEFSYKFNAARRVVGQHATLSTVSWCHLSAGDTQSRGADVKTARKETRERAEKAPQTPPPLSSHSLSLPTGSTRRASLRWSALSWAMLIVKSSQWESSHATMPCSSAPCQHCSTRTRENAPHDRPAARVPLHASRAMPSSRTGWATWLYPFDVGSCARVAWKGFMRPQV